MKTLLAFTIFLLTSSVQAAPVDINRASIAEIAAALPGIGKTKAAAIVAHREQFGPFRDIVQLIDVSGIGEKLFDRIRPDVLIDNQPLD